MFPIFTLSIVLFIVLAIFRKKSTDAQEEVERKFWDKEVKANSTRRKDLSELDYITIPLEVFPLGLDTENERAFIALANEKIINLHGMSNTDLKLEYGAANLEELTQYETNFFNLQQTIESYASELAAADRIDDAIMVLEFAISKGADVTALYTHLAELYVANGEADSIDGLIQIISTWNSLTKDSLIHKLQTIRNPEDSSQDIIMSEDGTVMPADLSTDSTFTEPEAEDDNDDDYAFLRRSIKKKQAEDESTN